MKTDLAYKNQIVGFENVSETVKVVEKIAASSVHFLKLEVASLRAYASGIESVLARLSLYYKDNEHPLLKKKAGKRALIILTGEKGLVGGLWQGLVSTVLDKKGLYDHLIVVGTKGSNYLKEEGVRVAQFFVSSIDLPDKKEITPVVDYVFGGFNKNLFSQVDILYPQFISLAEQAPAIVSFLPFQFVVEGKNSGAIGLPIFEPSKKEVYERFLQKYISMYFHNIIIETKLSELSARMVAMEHASVKTDEFVKKFTFDYTKARHRIATQKQLESFAVHKII